jgi:hypothetical protein
MELNLPTITETTKKATLVAGKKTIQIVSTSKVLQLTHFIRDGETETSL